MNWFRKLARKITPAEAAASELAEAEMAVLTARSGVEYAKSLVDYNEARIKRLRKFLAELDKGDKSDTA